MKTPQKGDKMMRVCSMRDVKNVLCALLVWQSANAATIYANKDATGAKNRPSRADAFATLQPAMDAASSEDGGVGTIARCSWESTGHLALWKD
jgi:hypothetical protein